MQLGYRLRHMVFADYPRVRAVWEESKSLRLGDSDSAEAIARYLDRNPGLSTVAVTGDRANEQVVGTVLCGHDGRWGIIRHLIVAPAFHHSDAHHKLLEACFHKLGRLGYRSAVLFIPTGKPEVIDLWKARGWVPYDTMPMGHRIA